MKKIMTCAVLILWTMLVLAGSSFAGKPDKTIGISNGFPSGPHHNLNIIGKKDGFVCPEQEYALKVVEDNSGDGDLGQVVEICDDGDVCEEVPVYGNVIFVPESGEGIEIVMQSGKGAEFEALQSLQVLDPCATDGSQAVLQLPKNDAGYRVYARALAKPGDDRRISTSPQLTVVQDETGQGLVFLGNLTATGFDTSDGYIYRSKGKSKALDITRLFEWSGLVCSATEADGLTSTSVCGMDTDGDLIPDQFTEMLDGGLCPDGYAATTLFCASYTDTWVFNIGALVDYLWTLENQGVKLLQIRFYPN